MRLICWECQNEGETWGPAVTCFRRLLQYQKCEFPHMPLSGHGATTTLETSPRMKAASLVQKGGETA